MYDNNAEVCDLCLSRTGLAAEQKRQRIIYPYKGQCEDCGISTKKLWRVGGTDEKRK